MVICCKKKAGNEKLNPSPDRRGRKEPPNKLCTEDVKKIHDHILLYNPCITHYRRQHAPNRLYISPMYSSRKMYKDFKESNPDLKVSHTRYWEEIKAMNISFVKLGEEECELGDLQDAHLKEIHGLEKQNDRNKIKDPKTKKVEKVSFQGCKICSKYIEPINYANESRSAYRSDKDRSWKNELVVSGDLMKVTMCPEMPGLKKSIFAKRIVLFHETFAPVGGAEKGKPVGVLWHEGISSRKGEDVAAVFLTYLRTLEDIKTITIWLDNCAAQGENCWLYTALANEVNKQYGNFESITLKYFEPGHTFMSADSFHHTVEQGMKKKRRMMDNFHDFVDVVEKNGEALVMKYDDFCHIPHGVSQGSFARYKPKLDTVRVAHFQRGSQMLHWRTNHNEGKLHKAEFLMRKVAKMIGTEFKRRKEPRGINSAKVANIIQVLCPHMAPVKRRFWLELSTKEGLPDLQTERDLLEDMDDDATDETMDLNIVL